MNKPPIITAKFFYHALIKFGCRAISSEGSHFKVEFPPTGRRSTIPVHGKKDIKLGFMKTILGQLGINADEFIEFLIK
ncbi:MAG: type II toxin-antitoxin system HicA family toxin [Defluviitaleaceae bacterium]|nr:type II toxin-antitoxin system HicA family toxin [Defluviitaleaceae bacterium]MCL2275723.1 type II toxin-antitoxin system HicA family toxin [Defluviitaleaceae bacterium]